jgi:hypothetical protein
MDELEPYPGQGHFAVVHNLQPMVACLDRPGEGASLVVSLYVFRHITNGRKKKTFLNLVSQVKSSMLSLTLVLFVNFVGVEWKEEGKKRHKKKGVDDEFCH